jgi:hypothetical protein
MAAIVAVLSGCGSTNSTTFRSMSAAYREVVESYSNDNILINVVRASQKMPVSFLDIPSIMGTGNVSASASVSGTVYSANPGSFGGFLQPWSGAVGLANYIPSASMSVSGGYTFTQSSLDNATFMKPFLSAIQPEIVGYLSANQAAPKSVLYSLVIDSIDVVTQNKDVLTSFVNDPSKEDYLSFQRALYVLVAAGLSVEPTFMKVPQSPVMDEATMRASMGMFAAALATGVTVDEIATPGRPKQYQLVRLLPQFRMCLNRTDGQVLFGDSLASSMYCTQIFKARAPSRTATELGKLLSDFGDQKYKNLSINIKLRSTRNVFDFLGQVVAMQNQEKPTVVKIFNPEALEAKANSTAEDFPPVPLFIVHKNQRLANTLTALEYRGATYSIPDDHNSFSKEVMVLLSQLLTLNKIAGSIPPSPSVLVK